MFFLHENKTTFQTIQQVSLPKEDEWYCDFKHTVYLRVSSFGRFFSSQFFACQLKVWREGLQRNSGDGLLLTQITGIYLWLLLYLILFNVYLMTALFIYLFIH